jgi:hypothetical protein
VTRDEQRAIARKGGEARARNLILLRAIEDGRFVYPVRTVPLWRRALEAWRPDSLRGVRVLREHGAAGPPAVKRDERRDALTATEYR